MPLTSPPPPSSYTHREHRHHIARRLAQAERHSRVRAVGVGERLREVCGLDGRDKRRERGDANGDRQDVLSGECKVRRDEDAINDVDNAVGL